jgi:hypothetical protein
MRYLFRARVKPGREQALLKAIEDGALGRGSVAGDEYFRNMDQARLCEDDTVRWVEICFCYTPLAEERPYWEKYFELTRIQDAHDRRKCRDRDGSEPWACEDCDCTARLEHKLETTGEPFLEVLRRAVAERASPAPVAVSQRTKDDTAHSSGRPATRPHPSAA